MRFDFSFSASLSHLSNYRYTVRGIKERRDGGKERETERGTVGERQRKRGKGGEGGGRERQRGREGEAEREGRRGREGGRDFFFLQMLETALFGLM